MYNSDCGVKLLSKLFLFYILYVKHFKLNRFSPQIFQLSHCVPNNNNSSRIL